MFDVEGKVSVLLLIPASGGLLNINQYVLVAGGSKGLGRELSLSLVKRGMLKKNSMPSHAYGRH